MAHPTTGDITSGSAVITALSDTSSLAVGMLITGAGIPENTHILTVDSGVQITADKNATATTTGVSLEFQSLLAAALSIGATVTSNLDQGSPSTVQLAAALAISATMAAADPITGVYMTSDMAAGATVSADLTIPVIKLESHMHATGATPPEGIDLAFVQELESRMAVTATVKANLLNSVSLASTMTATVTTSACLDQGMDGIGVCHAVREALRLWGIENVQSASSTVRERALNDINAALQTVWSYSKDRDYWTRATETVTINGGSSSLALDNTIQNVIGPARISNNNRPLVPLGSIDEVENYAIYYQGSKLHQTASGTAKAYYIERTSQTGNEPAKCTIHLAPTPTSNTTVKLDVVKEAPRFEWSDYNKCSRIPIPHQYIESLFLPILRYRATSYRLFYDKENRQGIIDEYQVALGQLNMNDPSPAKDMSQEGDAS